MSDQPYFAPVGDEVASGGTYVDVARDAPMVEFSKGLRFQPVLGDGVLVNYVRFDPHTEAPVHVHAEEQITLVIEGELEFELDGEVRTLQAGQAAVIPPHVPHGARTRDSACLELDVFCPPRKALLALLEAQPPTQE